MPILSHRSDWKVEAISETVPRRRLVYNIANMVSRELLDMLVCPLCKKPVALTESKTGLKCVQCHRVYPIQDDIPIMLIDSATIEP